MKELKTIEVVILSVEFIVIIVLMIAGIVNYLLAKKILKRINEGFISELNKVQKYKQSALFIEEAEDGDLVYINDLKELL